MVSAGSHNTTAIEIETMLRSGDPAEPASIVLGEDVA